MELFPGQTYELNTNANTVAAVGLRVQIVRKTGSGRFTVKAMESKGPYVAGSTFQVQPDALGRVQLRADELVARYEETKADTIYELNSHVRRAQAAREKVAAAILAGTFEALTYQVRWGNGVAEEIRGSYSERVLAHAQEVSIEEALESMVEYMRQELTRYSHKPTSSSAYHNAVEITRNEVIADLVSTWQRDVQRIRAARGAIDYAAL